MDGAPPAPLVGPARYRRVTLGWAGVTVSRAENWYLPQRLPEGVAQRLLDSRVPFGVLLDPFAPQRRIIAAGESADHLLEVRAALALDGTDVALVIERYDRALLAFRAPRS